MRSVIPSCNCLGQAGSSTAHWRPPATAAANATANRVELYSDKTVMAGAAGHQCRRLVTQAGPAEAISGHDDGSFVGTVIGPALESVEKWHRTNFTVAGRRCGLCRIL